MTDAILTEVVTFFISSAQKDSFNGIAATSLLHVIGEPNKLRQHLTKLILEKKIACAFASISVNPHIKRLPDLPPEEQIALLDQNELNTICVYPSAEEICKQTDITLWNNRPFSKHLALAEPQLSFRAFEMGVLERYTNDPRYVVHFNDYMGQMTVTDDFFQDEQFPGRDKIAIQTFGLGFDDSRAPYIVVFLRYLSNLTPEHQQYWNSYLVNSDVRMTRPYYEASFLGEFWKNRSIRHAIMEEMRIVNRMSDAIWGQKLFREPAGGDVPIGLTSFLRPTADNFHRFIMALDKLLSESINTKFFKNKILLESEIIRSDGKVEVQRKGTLTLLEEWLLSEITWSDEKEFREVIIDPLRQVRKLRQTPAHTFTKDNFSIDYYDRRKNILWSVFNSLSNIRVTFGKHPNAAEIEQPAWLDNESIEVF
ncbi:MAG: hypothetical protein HC850_01795 [Rhodomicrobium sp.]|nr:hypothetical protein [Rhodomicrobium sp.]